MSRVRATSVSVSRGCLILLVAGGLTYLIWQVISIFCEDSAWLSSMPESSWKGGLHNTKRKSTLEGNLPGNMAGLAKGLNAFGSLRLDQIERCLVASSTSGASRPTRTAELSTSQESYTSVKPRYGHPEYRSRLENDRCQLPLRLHVAAASSGPMR